METRLANIELQLGRKLTGNDHSLMELWYEMFNDEHEEPIRHDKATAMETDK